ncbi:MAG: hypothetical protein AB1689_17100, partial [Thermodesulfobacteriota bacterium]
AREARAVTVCSSAELCAPAANPCTVSVIRDVAAGCHLDFGSRSVVLTGALQADTPGGSFSVSAGELTVTGGRIRSVGPTGFAGGSVTVTVTGAFRMNGTGPALDVGGAAGGGVLRVDAGSIEILAGGVGADGTGTESCGGVVGMRAASGPLLVAAPVHATGNFLCAGGYIELAGQGVEVRSPLNVTGGDFPGGVTLTAETGDLVVTSSASVRANGEQIDFEDGGDGGAIALLAEGGSVTLAGNVETDGASPEGEAGSIVVVAGGSVQASALLTAQGNGGGSNGGSIEIDAIGDVTLAGNVRATGGSLAGGGEIDVRSDGTVTIAAGKTVQASGGFFGGGAITIRDAASIVVSGAVEARGSSGGNAGFITFESCRATVAGPLDVTAGSGGRSGINSITAGVVGLTADARLLATPCSPLTGTSCNVFTTSGGTPAIDPLAVVTPAPAVGIDVQLAMCCGNATLEPGETCDDGNGVGCDGCSHLCQLEPTPACPSDGNECTADCVPHAGCVYAPRAGQSCSDDGNACTSDLCSAAGTCAHPVRQCNDGIACTVDACQAGVGCVATPDDARCNDGESCTSETCVPSLGCQYEEAPDGTACSDGDVCTTQDECVAGGCVAQGPELECDDDDPCTEDSCHAALGCRNEEDALACGCSGPSPLPAGTACADGNDCTRGDVCDGSGACTPGESCPDDGDACTAESCIVGGGVELCLSMDNQCVADCAASSDGAPCSDGSACTTGVCESGVCTTAPVACGDGDPCTGEDYCVAVLGCRSAFPPVGDPLCEAPASPLDAFACYRSSSSKGAPAFAPLLGVPVADRFAGGLVDVRKPQALCMPADVAGDDPEAPSHPDKLASHQMRVRSATPSGEPLTDVEVVNRFGSVRVNLRKAERLSAPTAVSTVAPPGAPLPPDPDHLTCYKVAPAPGTPKFLPILGVPVRDQLGTLTVDLRRPARLCTPADVNGLDPGAPGHALQLLCYQAKTSSGTPRFVKRSNVFTGNGLGSAQVDLLALAEVCVPSTIVTP